MSVPKSWAHELDRRTIRESIASGFIAREAVEELIEWHRNGNDGSNKMYQSVIGQGSRKSTVDLLWH
jgi:hypothetical protein